GARTHPTATPTRITSTRGPAGRASWPGYVPTPRTPSSRRRTSRPGPASDAHRLRAGRRRARRVACADLLPDELQDAGPVDPLCVPVPRERVTPAPLPVAVDRARVSSPVAQNASVPGAALHRVP